MPSLDRMERTETGIEVSVGGTDLSLSWRWLRDHGEDDLSFDRATRQRRVYALDAREPDAATGVRLVDIDGVPAVALTWPDVPEETWISQATLSTLVSPRTGIAPELWHSPDEATISEGTVAEVLADDGALRDWLGDIARVGFARLSGFAGGHDETAELATRIGPPMSTIFGTTWDLASDLDSHDDTAYTQTFLAPHTDGTYLHHAPRLQMFCCVERSGTGGESVIVDAFAVAESLRADHPEDFEVLTSVSVPGHYIEPGVELRTARPAILLDASGAIVQVSMNNYDRSPMVLPPTLMDAFYRAYGRLHDLANDRNRWKSIRLEAGDVLINDNWRVLHGREAYTGGRRFVGCYINHEDFESRRRTLDL